MSIAASFASPEPHSLEPFRLQSYRFSPEYMSRRFLLAMAHPLKLESMTTPLWNLHTLACSPRVSQVDPGRPVLPFSAPCNTMTTRGCLGTPSDTLKTKAQSIDFSLTLKFEPRPSGPLYVPPHRCSIR
ncbi:hypothetical protein PCANC_18363 [Puccinia coronata f. sp. avenae]|uniref:Uncharacterized protein n=1 Tax=Puccinia coronata f. sp. avenae TaxID=200324 RepID=A0A2N5V1A9_9BASI|nr:hypothetical protein PCANC_19986 [Puccinia coronata f. sp. avenae]PLW22105.1 hypothetical protein PCANC_28124 [Puccinia coronata f. sp. avenae]PLW35067.1 hypothetical protein PCASD_16172 [Puccinia coronata f. sp. avenae]PLW43800.1 hypothetical protein PCANC_18363 [Puccinia coronata f. sp. avenae]